MTTEWKTVAIGRIAEIFDGPHATPPKTSHGPIFLGISNLVNGRLDLTNIEHLSEDDYARWTKRVEPIAGDVVFSYETRLGEAAIIPAGLRSCLGRRMGLLRARTDVIDSRFLLYSYLGPQFQEVLRSRAVHGSTVDRIPLVKMPGFPIEIPANVDEQRAIAGVLGALDDKIEQNRRTARALENLARAIFQAWFVDFEPVKVKAAGVTSFPSMPQQAFDALPTRLVDSDIGPVPEGWTFRTIGELAKRFAMGPFGSDIKTDNFVPEGVPVIRGGNLTNGFVDEDFVYLTESKADQLSNANAFPGDIVITHRGTLGQVGLIPAKSRHRRYVVSQSQMLIRPSPDVLPSHFLYLFLTSTTGQHELLANRSQTGVPAISRPTASVKAIRLMAPDNLTLRHFESIVSKLFDCGVAIQAESRKLAQMRDYLLPKLLSGEVRVANGTGREGRP